MAPHVIEGESGVKQVQGDCWLKNDGTVWNGSGKIKTLQGISLIGYGGKQFAALTSNGDVLLADPYKLYLYNKVGTVADAASVIALAAYDRQVAVLYGNGKVIVFRTSDFDDNGKIIPFTITEDAAHIAFAKSTGDHPTDALLVTRKDGTVWMTGNYKDRNKLTEQVSRLSQIVKTSVLEDCEHFYAMRSDGSWVFFNEGEITPVDVPSVKQLDISVSDPNPFVGDGITLGIQETYTNGAKIKVQASQADIKVQKPHLLAIQPDGTFKVLGVGQIEATVTSGGLTKTVTISSSLRNNLNYAKLIEGVVYVPVKPVVQALGGTVASSDGGVEVALGDISLSLKPKSTAANLNGEPFQLKAAPIVDKQGMMMPASLLIDVTGAGVKWNSQWKQAEITYGQAGMIVVSADTAGLVKKVAQGSLAKYVGKSYWVNYFQGWDRFSKVTVTDIQPVELGEFVVVFKSASGKKLESYPMSSSYVTDLFADGSSFFNYDPYKKYKWSSTVWSQIKAGYISLGMTKEQVLLSWGAPAGKDATTAKGKVIETWVYADFDTIVFIDGKLSIIVN
ncbi:copper amine oxidase-like protein [Fontibacillus phaseoli]|uniref:Copper amine oxidase-like protein n=1 Tax=Fontibacillus phaseoli TaxID=1416533 RepID=A0A369BJK3_9BACL|nr:copper amine oxidase-like protein [Fontibacillus phaseoli]